MYIFIFFTNVQHNCNNNFAHTALTWRRRTNRVEKLEAKAQNYYQNITKVALLNTHFLCCALNCMLHALCLALSPTILVYFARAASYLLEKLNARTQEKVSNSRSLIYEPALQ